MFTIHIHSNSFCELGRSVFSQHFQHTPPAGPLATVLAISAKHLGDLVSRPPYIHDDVETLCHGSATESAAVLIVYIHETTDSQPGPS